MMDIKNLIKKETKKDIFIHKNEINLIFFMFKYYKNNIKYIISNM